MRTTPDITGSARADGRLVFHDFEPPTERFLDAALRGLDGERKSIPCRFLYDRRGSELFDAICRLPEYYPTRTELKILRTRAAEIAEHIGPDAELIELGSGSSSKVRLLLDAVTPGAYVPIDISREHLRQAGRRIAESYPGLEVHAVCVDYASAFDLPRTSAGGQRVAFYPGSTIGNFDPHEAEGFLRTWAERLGHGSALLIGVDLRKSRNILEPAYDDAQGVTAAFSKNLLVRANRELGADFNLDAFAHEARYNEDRGVVEINLRSLRAQTVTLAGRAFRFAQGEPLHVENSWKYDLPEFGALARRAGFATSAVWTDEDRLFSIHLLTTSHA